MLTNTPDVQLPVSLARLVDLLQEASEKEKITPQRAKELVQMADVQEEDLRVFADFEHPCLDCYGRKLVVDTGKFEVMVMSWNPCDYSSIHNHGYTEWGAVQVFGNTHHFIYHIKDNELRFSVKEFLPKGAVVKVNNALIHQMGNATSDPYLTLHVYGSNKPGDKQVTADAMNFEIEFDRIVHTTGGAFFNLPEEEIYDFEQGPKVAPDVFFHYANLLMDYYNRQQPSPKIDALREALYKKMVERSASYN